MIVEFNRKLIDNLRNVLYTTDQKFWPYWRIQSNQWKILDSIECVLISGIFLTMTMNLLFTSFS